MQYPLCFIWSGLSERPDDGRGRSSRVKADHLKNDSFLAAREPRSGSTQSALMRYLRKELLKGYRLHFLLTESDVPLTREMLMKVRCLVVSSNLLVGSLAFSLDEKTKRGRKDAFFIERNRDPQTCRSRINPDKSSGPR